MGLLTFVKSCSLSLSIAEFGKCLKLMLFHCLWSIGQLGITNEPILKMHFAVAFTITLPLIGNLDLLSEEMKRSPESHHDSSLIPQEGEPDFYETHCHWKGCSLEFDTQDELVKVNRRM